MNTAPSQPPLPPPVRLVVGLSSSEPELFDELIGRLALEYGSVLFESGRSAADAGSAATDALEGWVALDEPIDPDQIVQVKLHALRVERLYLNPQNQKRILLDVAYVDPARVVRAAEHDAVHRIYLGAGIYGEIILRWRQSGGFEPMPWTRPEHAVPERRGFFGRVREEWIQWLKQAKQPKPTPPG
jgi:hypothetical protein